MPKLEDIVVTHLTQEEEAEFHGKVRCSRTLPNKMQCSRKIEYKVIFENLDKKEFLCEGHYQLLINTDVDKRITVRH